MSEFPSLHGMPEKETAHEACQLNVMEAELITQWGNTLERWLELHHRAGVQSSGSATQKRPAWVYTEQCMFAGWRLWYCPNLGTCDISRHVAPTDRRLQLGCAGHCGMCAVTMAWKQDNRFAFFLPNSFHISFFLCCKLKKLVRDLRSQSSLVTNKQAIFPFRPHVFFSRTNWSQTQSYEDILWDSPKEQYLHSQTFFVTKYGITVVGITNKMIVR